MSEEIVRRLRNRSSSSMNYLKESLPVRGLLEADEDQEEEENPVEIEDDSPEDDSPEEDIPKNDKSDDELGDDIKNPDDEDLSDDEEEDDTKHANPLDNPYAVNFKIGQSVALTYANGTKSKLVGTIDGYDIEGFYRIKWSHGKTTNGITDIALADLVQGAVEEHKCICGSKEFVTENNKIICDKCGRLLSESIDPLTKADRDRPKGKKLIRSEAHPMSTTMNESTSDSGYAVLYSYDGDDLSDYHSTVVVVSASEEEAIKIAKSRISVGRHFEIDRTIGKKGYIPSVSAWKAAHPRSNYEILECDNIKKSIGNSIRKAFKYKNLE